MISVRDLKPGMELGRYRLVRELGRGAMGLVFLAEDSVLREKLCVKVLHPQLQMNTEAVERFHREIVLARRISHRGVCRLHDLHREQDVLFLTMEYVEGKSLRDVLIDRSPLPLSEVTSIIRSICDALAAAHDVGVIHRDLKPRNIIVRDVSGDVSLLDFGIATALDFVSSLTLPGVALGTNSYISPEVWAGRPATPRSDQYAVGVIFYNCLTNKMPFASGGQPIPLAAIKGGALPPSAHRKGLPAAIDAIVLRALSYDPAERYADVRALSRAVEQVLLVDEQTLPLASIPTVSAPVDADTRGAPPGAATDVTLPVPAEPAEPWQVPTLPSFARPTHEKDALEKREKAALAKLEAEKRDTTHEDEQTSPALTGVNSDSASWVVGGRPVGLPAIPKVIAGALPPDEGLSSKMLPEPAAKPQKSRAPLAIGALLAIGVGAAVVFALDDDATTVSDDAVATHVAPVATAPVNTFPGGTGVPPVMTGGTPVPPAPSQLLVDTAPVDTAPTVVTPPAPEGVDVSEADAARARKKPKETNDRSDRTAYAQASAALAKELGARGLRNGDDAELDRARALASSMAAARKWGDARNAMADARARARDVAIDRALVEKKLRRFNDAFDRITDEELRGRVDVNATRALADMASGRFDAANRALNEGFVLMEKRR